MLRQIIILLLLCTVGCTKGGAGGSSDGACSNLIGAKVTNGEGCERESSNPVVLIVIAGAQGEPQGICSGTLISSTKILTAAHCLASVDGAYFINVNGNIFPAASAVEHERYDGAVGNPFDVAILTLAAPQPVIPEPVLISRSVPIGEKVTVFGYGRDEDGESATDKGADSLKAGRMEVTDYTGGLIKAEFDETGSSACNGDSGGPAVFEDDGVSGIVGIVSIGTVGNCLEGTEVFFTDVQLVVDFIMKHAPDASVS